MPNTQRPHRLPDAQNPPSFTEDWRRGTDSVLKEYPGQPSPSTKRRRHSQAGFSGGRFYGGRFSVRYQLRVAATLTARLFSFLVKGSWKWLYMFFLLWVFAFCLLPGAVVMLWYWYRYPIHNISYNASEGSSSRQLLDIYLPTSLRAADGTPLKKADDRSAGVPVIVFLTGGAWVIGYKAWGALMGRALCPHGVMLVVPDYRNFPQANITQMQNDCDMAVQWVIDNIADYGGDPTNIVLVGQSAGAHLGSLMMLNKAAAAAKGDRPPRRAGFAPEDEFRTALHRTQSQSTRALAESRRYWLHAADGSNTVRISFPWSPTDLRGFVPISGIFDVPGIQEHFHNRGLDKRIFDWVFQEDLEKFSPQIVAERLRQQRVDLAGFFPPVCIIHGDKDMSAPCSQSELFGPTLRALGIDAEVMIYKNMTHTDPIIEKPLAGEQQLHADIYELCRKYCPGHKFVEFDSTIPSCRRATPQFLINLSRRTNPF